MLACSAVKVEALSRRERGKHAVTHDDSTKERWINLETLFPGERLPLKRARASRYLRGKLRPRDLLATFGSDIATFGSRFTAPALPVEFRREATLTLLLLRLSRHHSPAEFTSYAVHQSGITPAAG